MQLIADSSGLDNRFVTDFDVCAPTGGGAWMDFSRERYRTRHRGGFGRGPPPNATAESDAEDAGASTGEPATPKR